MYYDIAPDTCGIVNLMKNQGSERRFLKGIKGKNLRFVIPSFVVKEVKKVADFDKDEIIAYFSRFSKKVSIISPSSDAELASAYFEKKYPESHFPDTLLLATAMFNSYVILTYDIVVLACARSEGIKTICPKGVIA
jgi:rRNA-processing protein FCF1